jgi:hypothetical protein
MIYCVQCKHAKLTSEQNLYECQIVTHNVVGMTVACRDFEPKESEGDGE